MTTRTIIHLDLDAFYASVETILDPDLAGKPLVVGGRAENRGVVATASYAARKYGIHSAMPMATALRLCPQVLVKPPQMKAYRDYSRQVMDILFGITSKIQIVSIDEAYIDISDLAESWQAGIEIGHQLKAKVHELTGLTASLGISTNKLISKVASDRDKPDGLTAVDPGEEARFLEPLPIKVIPGIGPKTRSKLHKLGIYTVGELARFPAEILSQKFGQYGTEMMTRAQGIDRRPLVLERKAKSISQETTFSKDLADLDSLKRQLWRLSQQVGTYLRRKKQTAGTIAIKIRYADFSTLSRQSSIPVGIVADVDIYRIALSLFENTWEGKPVRLLGISARQFGRPETQLSLDLEV